MKELGMIQGRNGNMSYNYETAHDNALNECRTLRKVIQEQEQEIKDLRSELNDMINDDPNSKGTVNLDELGFMDCGVNSWTFIDDENYGCEGTEVWEDPKTKKRYNIEWDKIRHIKNAVEVI